MNTRNNKSNKTSKTNKTQEVRRETGASQSRTSIGDQFNSYLANHRLVARDSLDRLRKNLLPSMMTWLVIGIALALPTGLFVALNNVENLSSDWDGAAQISLFLQKSVSTSQGRSLASQLAEREDIASVEYISRDQALAEFQALSGYGEVLDKLETNPLPAVIVVRPIEQAYGAQATVDLYEEFKEIAQVDQVVLDLEWVQRLYGLMALGQRMAMALAALLSVGVLLVIGNTIRLAIESRRDEIVIVKLVGGTNAFVRRPFLYTGVWYGLGGGVVAWLVIMLSVLMLADPVAELAGLYKSDFVVQGLGFGYSLLLWLASALLGLAGAWLAVGRHLSDIEPR